MMVKVMLSENDVKEELSYVYAHAVATRVGYSAERIIKDRDSVDMITCAKGAIDPTSIFQSPRIELQLKATSQEIDGDVFPLKLSLKNYNDLRANSMVPRILVVLTLPTIREEWVDFKEHLILKGKAHWLSLAGCEACENNTNKTVYIQKKNIFNDISLKKMMIAASKREAFYNDT
jgi:Domain of unknown function (DUF4365)